MLNKSFGFIGGGRVVNILLKVLSKTNKLPQNIYVHDNNISVLEKLQSKYPTIKTTDNNQLPAKCNYVFISLHPPVIVSTLESIKEEINEDSIIISLAPKISINKIKEIINKNVKVIRLIPNAPSYIGKGYNPVVFSENFNENEKIELMEFFNIFGSTPEVEERKLESYALITAMGPTYLWFQLAQLYKLGKEFNLTDEELKDGITEMVKGCVDTLFNSGLTFNEVMDLIPVKPLSESEKTIEDIYGSNLRALYTKLTN
ncbi:MAG TPA: NAD(P)-binding domain-containing protein [Melioribacteraceae bacterium]|nr:NAD(P)-binding domain-containing protein [Melioribacteraceae bacterium]